MSEIHFVIAPWQLLTFGLALITAVCGALFTMGKILGAQWEQRQEERFKSQEAARIAATETWQREFRDIKAALSQEGQAWRQVERDLMSLKAELPVSYVRREDWVRNQTIIEAKIDGLALRLENAQLKGEGRGHP